MTVLLPVEELNAVQQDLASLGIPLDSPALGDLIAGSAAAAPGLPGAWLAMIGPIPADHPVRDRLEALRQTAQAAYQASAVPLPKRLEALRDQLRADKLDGFLVPHGDEYQSEFPPPGNQRLAWLTGFTGSAGAALVMTEGPAELFIDGRYTLQARDQVDNDHWTFRHLISEPPMSRLEALVQPGQRIGYDPALHGLDARARLVRVCRAKDAEAVAVTSNPLDAVWTDRPPPPLSPAHPHPLERSGLESAEKRLALGEALSKDGHQAVVLSAPDSIAWLLNIRGTDVGHTPLVLSLALAHADGSVDLFIDPRKVDDALKAHLGAEVRLHAEQAFAEVAAGLAAKDQPLRVVGATTTARTEDLLSEAGVTMTRGADPCVLPRATKNPVELEGTRDAHRRDGLALTKFLHWLSRFGAGPDGAPTGLTEQGAADRLEQFRREDPSLRDLSFDTIAGFGANGAIVHYRVSPETDKPLEAGELFLVDSGGQYPDGTTDVTRTVAIGADAVPPDAERIKRYTQVLKGHVALGMASFPEGTTGAQLDTLARTALWADGVDYDHGTGHGVGSYLGVHEGPARISKAGSVPLQPGMILSNEPGYYKTGAFGIRIENLVVVHQQDAMPGGEKPMLCFETLTLAPYDRALIDPSLLTQAERDWVDAYQAHVFQFHAPHLSPEAADWLAAVTAPLGNDPMVDSPEEALPAFDRQRSAS